MGIVSGNLFSRSTITAPTMDSRLNTIRSALASARRRLAAFPGLDPLRDAELLLRHITSLSKASLLAHPETELTPDQASAYAHAIERRCLFEPVQYINGTQEFYGLAFHVTPAVLIPRPETEHLVEAALHAAQARPSTLHILDIGTGSGAIAITLACNLPNASITATDISSAALEVARTNAQHHGVADRIRFIEADLCPPGLAPFDIICSNPPYIGDNEILEPQVASFEPHTALFAGPDGLAIYQRLIPIAAAALVPAGTLLLEIGHGQQAAIASLLQASHLQMVNFMPDLQGIPRVAIATTASLHGH